MKLNTYFKIGIIMGELLFGVSLFAQSDATPIPLFSSDGSILTEEFETESIPDGWLIASNGGNRKDISFQKGSILFNTGKGDNNIAMPPLNIDPEQSFVIEVSFELPEPVRSEYSLITLNRLNGTFSVVLVETGDSTRVMMGKKNLGTVKVGKSYTFAMLCEPDGTYKGVLTGNDVERPTVGTYTDADGAVSEITIGNTRSAGDGSLLVESVKIGKPAP